MVAQYRFPHEIFFRILGTLKQSSQNRTQLALCHSKMLSPFLAIATLPQDGRLSLDEPVRIMDDAAIMMRLRHPNIPVCWGVLSNENRPCIMREYVHGLNLDEVRRMATKPIPMEVACSIFSQLCDALCFTYERQRMDGSEMYLVHGNINSTNILVSVDGYVKLIGFKFDGFSSGIMDGTVRFEAEQRYEDLVAQWRQNDLRSLARALGKLLGVNVSGELNESGTRRPCDTVPDELRTLIEDVSVDNGKSPFISLVEFSARLHRLLSESGRLLSPTELKEWFATAFPRWLSNHLQVTRMLTHNPALAGLSGLIRTTGEKNVVVPSMDDDEDTEYDITIATTVRTKS